MKDIQSKVMEYGSTAADKFKKMTTTQKAVVGGAVLALGAGWMALSSKNKNKIKNQVSSAASMAADKMKEANKNQNSSSSGNQSNRSGSGSSSNSDARVK